LYQKSSKRDIQHIRPFAQSALSAITQPLTFLLITQPLAPYSHSNADGSDEEGSEYEDDVDNDGLFSGLLRRFERAILILLQILLVILLLACILLGILLISNSGNDSKTDSLPTGDQAVKARNEFLIPSK
jgi:hypothetical protein